MTMPADSPSDPKAAPAPAPAPAPSATAAALAALDWPQLLEHLGSLVPVDPHGTFRWLHHAYWVRSRQRLEGPQKLDWHALAQALENEPSRIDDARLLPLFDAHAWTLGRDGYYRFLDIYWAQLSPEARGAALAGGSDLHRLLELEDIDPAIAMAHSATYRDRATPHLQWLRQRLLDSPEFLLSPSAANVLELFCNAIVINDTSLLERAVALARQLRLLGHSVERMEPSYRGILWARVGYFAEEVSGLSDRLADLMLEAALAMKHLRGTELALEAGADPQLKVWVLDRSYNEHHTPLSYALKLATPLIAELLLAHGATAAVRSASQPLYLAIVQKQDDLAAQLIASGTPFDQIEPPHWLLDSADSDSPHYKAGMPFNYATEGLNTAERLGKDLPLPPPSRTAWFFTPNSQGGYYRTILSHLLDDDDLPRLQRFAALGLPLIVTAPDLSTALTAGARNCLPWLAGQLNAPPSFMEGIRREFPVFREG